MNSPLMHYLMADYNFFTKLGEAATGAEYLGMFRGDAPDEAIVLERLEIELEQELADARRQGHDPSSIMSKLEEVRFHKGNLLNQNRAATRQTGAEQVTDPEQGQEPKDYTSTAANLDEVGTNDEATKMAAFTKVALGMSLLPKAKAMGSAVMNTPGLGKALGMKVLPGAAIGAATGAIASDDPLKGALGGAVTGGALGAGAHVGSNALKAMQANPNLGIGKAIMGGIRGTLSDTAHEIGQGDELRKLYKNNLKGMP